MGALLIGRIVLVMAASIAAGSTGPSRPGSMSVDSEVATGLVRRASHDQEAECRSSDSSSRDAAWRFSCDLPQEWAEVDIRATRAGRGFVVLPGSVRGMPGARHRSPSFFGAFDLSDIVCIPRGDRVFLCDARFDETGYATDVEVRLRRTPYGSLVENCRLTRAKPTPGLGALWACQHLAWDVDQPTSTARGMAEMSGARS